MQSRREQILDAAINCFIRKGIHLTSMKDICNEAELSIGALYIHFKSKKEIIEATWKQYLQLREAAYQHAYQSETIEKAANIIVQGLMSKLQHAPPDKTWQLWIQLLSEAIINPEINEMLQQSWKMNDELYLNLRRRLAVERDVHVDEEFHHIIGRISIAVHDGLILQKILDPEQEVHKYCEVFTSIIQQIVLGNSEAKKEAKNEPIESKKN